jgi:hypothetical protein
VWDLAQILATLHSETMFRVCNAVSKERRVPEKIFAQLCFGLHQMVICADAQR